MCPKSKIWSIQHWTTDRQIWILVRQEQDFERFQFHIKMMRWPLLVFLLFFPSLMTSERRIDVLPRRLISNLFGKHEAGMWSCWLKVLVWIRQNRDLILHFPYKCIIYQSNWCFWDHSHYLFFWTKIPFQSQETFLRYSFMHLVYWTDISDKTKGKKIISSHFCC